MKKFRYLLSAILLILSLSCCKVNIDNNKPEKNTDINYVKSEMISSKTSNDLIRNPSEGFYTTYPVKFGKDEFINTIDYYNDDLLYHVRVSLADYDVNSALTNINQNTLNGFDLFLNKLEKQNATIIIRFAYDGFEGIANKEPSIDIIKNHIISISKILNKHQYLIKAIECGLIGLWGEMHTSDIVTQENINILLDTWLKYTNYFPILVRKPSFIYKYFGYDLSNLSSFEFKNDKEKRIGMFNDGYLGTKADTGTYIDRKKEVEFLSKLTTPFGGEVILREGNYTDLPSDIFAEQYKTHLSYLNSEYDDNVINKWKKSTFEYGKYQGFNKYNLMNNLMGYGLLLSSFSAYTNNDQLFINFNIDNTGFVPFKNNIKGKLIVKNDNYSYSKEFNFNLNNKDISFSKVKNGNYNVYLNLYMDNKPYFLINDKAKQNNSNLIGKITF